MESRSELSLINTESKLISTFKAAIIWQSYSNCDVHSVVLQPTWAVVVVVAVVALVCSVVVFSDTHLW